MIIQVNNLLLRVIILAFLGFCLTLAFAPSNNILLLFCTISLLLNFTDDRGHNLLFASRNYDMPLRMRSIFFASFIFWFAHFASGLSWITNSLNVVFADGVARFCLKCGIMLCLATTLGAMYGCVMIFVNHIVDYILRGGRCDLRREMRAIAACAAYGLLEYWRSYGLLPFPWLLLGDTMAFSSYTIQIFYLWSRHIVTVLVFFAAAAFYVRTSRYYICVVCLIFYVLSYGYYTYNNVLDHSSSSDIIIHPNIAISDVEDASAIFLIIQTNITEIHNTDDKKKNALHNNFHVTRRNLHAIAELRKRWQRNVVVVWPESAMQYIYDERSDNICEIWQSDLRLHNMITGCDTAALRTIDDDQKDWNIYNSMLVLDRLGYVQSIYHKKHLVPVGEYIPLSSILKFLHPIVGAISSFSKGDDEQNIISLKLDDADKGAQDKNSVHNTLNILPYICYDIAFPEGASTAGIAHKENADIALQITNDMWFGDSIGQDQHMAMVKIKAVELRKPMIRASNGGSSALIDARGKIIKILPQGVEDVMSFGLVVKRMG